MYVIVCDVRLRLTGRVSFVDSNVMQELKALAILRTVAHRPRRIWDRPSELADRKTLNVQRRYLRLGSGTTPLSILTPALSPKFLGQKQTRTMADDASYGAFLQKANQGVSSGGSNQPQSTSQARSKFDPTQSGASNGTVPKAIADIQATYVSDTDSDFEPVFFAYSGSGLPSPKDFEKCLNGKGSAEELKENEFDPRGQYKQVIEAVKSAGKGVKIFRVEIGGTRVEYYVLTLGDGKLLGVVARAVES